jgi:hypothetical protein
MVLLPGKDTAVHCGFPGATGCPVDVIEAELVGPVPLTWR